MSQFQAIVGKQCTRRLTTNSSSVLFRQTSLLQEPPACVDFDPERHSVNELLYRLTAVLVLQNLYSEEIRENRELKSRLQMHEIRSSQVREESQGENPRSLSVDDARSDENCLFPTLYQNLQLQSSEQAKVIAHVEGMTASGLVKVTS